MPNKRTRKIAAQNEGVVTMHDSVLRILNKRGMTQNALAEKMGFTRAYINSLLSQDNPGIQKVFAVADMLEVAVADIWPDHRLCHRRIGQPLRAVMNLPGSTSEAMPYIAQPVVAEPSLRYGFFPTLPSFLETQVSFGDDGTLRGAVPFYEDIYAYGGNAEQFFEGSLSPSAYIIIPNIAGCNFACRVSGDSMAEVIEERSIVACRELPDKRLVQWGNIYAVLTRDELLVKYVRRHKDERLLRLVSHNERFDDLDRGFDEVLRLYEVKIVINYKYGG